MKTYTIVRIELDTKTVEDAQERIELMLSFHKKFISNWDMNYRIGAPQEYDVSQDKPFGRPKVK